MNEIMNGEGMRTFNNTNDKKKMLLIVPSFFVFAFISWHYKFHNGTQQFPGDLILIHYCSRLVLILFYIRPCYHPL